jgi:hypothetical protein
MSIYGHGPEPEDVREVFENAVRAARAVTEQGETLSASLTVEGISITHADVVDLEAADVVEDGNDRAEELDPEAETPAGIPANDSVDG